MIFKYFRLDFFAYENGRRSTGTMGLATVGGVCIDEYACIIAEFGTTNAFGKPYPSAGFTSVYILAHEIGHKFDKSFFSKYLYIFISFCLEFKIKLRYAPRFVWK